MKIYTVTFNGTTNWGAVLQEYALYKYLVNNNYDVQVVKYCPEFMKKLHKPINKVVYTTGLFNKIKAFILLNKNIERQKKFSVFCKKNINYTTECLNVGDVQNLEQPDLYICGSDQIWNTSFVNKDQVYFLDFTTKSKKISYAASAGKDNIDDKEIDDIVTRISSLDFIAVREDYLYSRLKPKSIKPLYHVLDPVFLLEKNEYERLASKNNENKKYVLIYELAIDDKNYKVAQRLANEYDLKIIQINCFKKRYPVDEIIGNLSPEEFLSLFINADYIVTNSFHGTAFSIILEKQFYAIQLNKYNSRILSLLKSFELEERLVNNFNGNFLIEKINYIEKSSFIKRKIDESKKILERGIESV